MLDLKESWIIFYMILLFASIRANPRFRIAAIYPSVKDCAHPTINGNTENRYTTSRPLKMKFRNFKMVG
jgi:hypothetical protein